MHQVFAERPAASFWRLEEGCWGYSLKRLPQFFRQTMQLIKRSTKISHAVGRHASFLLRNGRACLKQSLSNLVSVISFHFLL
jgi:hypothetical protein